jgi:protein-L-isoaspartate(D-aspartate) O-methyltransferase
MKERDPHPGQSPLPFFPEADHREDEAIGVASFILSREVFAPRRFTDLSRTDIALPLPCGQTMTSPGSVAAMLVALGVGSNHRVLEIGTGSGYVTAVLAKLGAEVHSVERFNTLAESAAQHFKIVEASGIRLEVGDGLSSRPRERFDRILLNGAVPEIPPSVISLLGSRGRLVGALTINGAPRLVRIDRTEDGEWRQELGPMLRLSPLVPGIAATL